MVGPVVGAIFYIVVRELLAVNVSQFHPIIFGVLFMLIVLWAVWAALLLATLVPSTVSLTAGRVVAPMAIVAAIAASVFASVEGWKVAAAVVATVVASLVWFSGEIGLGFVQGSAYGNEQRFPLKPPIPTIVPVVCVP